MFIEQTFTNAGLIQGAPTTGNNQANITCLGPLTNTGTIALSTMPNVDGRYGPADFSLEREVGFGTGSLHMSGTAYLSAYVRLDGGTTISGAGTIVGTINELTDSSPHTATVAAIGGTLLVDASLGAALALSAQSAATLVLNGTVNNADTVTLSAATSTLQTTAANADLHIVSAAGGILTITGGGTATLNAADTNLTATLAAPGALTLSTLSFVTGIADTANATLVALAANQTLTSLAGADTLTGAAATGDTFRGTTAGLNHDTIGNFAGTDVIDITNLIPGANLVLDYTQGANQGTLTLTEGTQSTTLTLLGSFTQSEFTTNPDNSGVLLVGLTL